MRWRSDTNKEDLQGFNHERPGSVGIRKQYQPSLWPSSLQVPGKWRSRTSGFGPMPHLRYAVLGSGLSKFGDAESAVSSIQGSTGTYSLPEWTQVGMSQDPGHDNAKQTDPSFRFCVPSGRNLYQVEIARALRRGRTQMPATAEAQRACPRALLPPHRPRPVQFQSHVTSDVPPRGAPSFRR